MEMVYTASVHVIFAIILINFAIVINKSLILTLLSYVNSLHNEHNNSNI